MRKKILLSLVLLVIWVAVVCEPAVSQIKREKVEWVPSTIKGITPGKSKYKDVIRLFGKPDYEGEIIEDPPLKPPEEAPEALIELSYNRDIEIEGVLARIGFAVGDETRIVKYVSFYFYSFLKELTKEDAIKIYGNDYYVVTRSDYYNSTTREYASLCVYKSQKRNQEVKVDESDYPISLVYPQKGMYIQVRDDNTVMMMEYTDKCNNP